MELHLKRAIKAYEAGDLAAARERCAAVLARAPRNAVALHLMGTVCLQSGDAREAIAHLERAAALDPGNARIHADLGVAGMNAGDTAVAESALRRAVALGLRDAGTLCWLGIALAARDRHAEAVECFRGAAQLDPGNDVLHVNLGNALHATGALDGAEASYRRALQLNSGNAEAHNHLGSLLFARGAADEAKASYRAAIAAAPHYSEAHYNLGNLLRARRDLAGAVAAYRRALEIDGTNAVTHLNLGNALLEQGDLASARAAIERALALDPRNVMALCNLGTVCHDEGRRADEIACYERAIAIDPVAPDPQYNLGLARLYDRDFGAGWALYDRRIDCADLHAMVIRSAAPSVERFRSLPRWTGEPVQGVVGVWAEQGLGDQLLFSTLLPELLNAGVRCVVEVDGRLKGAYERSLPGTRFVAIADPPSEALLDASRHVLCGSLGRVYRRDAADFARQPRRLLEAVPQRVAHYRERLAQLGGGMKVGLSWKSSRGDRLAPKKSAPLLDLAPLLRTPGLTFVDVQYGETAAERVAVHAATGVRIERLEGLDYFADLEELLALLQACDAVVTTSNVTAHLAGVLGKRTWLMYPGALSPFHYWTHAPSDTHSLWYSSVSVVAGKHLPDWRAVSEAAAREIASACGA